MFDKMTYDEWQSTLSPKVTGTWNLHHAVAQESLDFFVVFSSIVGICGNIGQANYAAANTFLDSFTQYRRQLGLPCSALALGPVEDVGLVSRNPKILESIRATSTRILSESEVMEGLHIAISQSNTSKPNPVIVGLGNTRPLSDPGVRVAWLRDMRYAPYYSIDSEVNTTAVEASDNMKLLLAKIERNPPLLDDPETKRAFRQELGNLISQHMPNAENMDDEQREMIAIDSLMAIEIKGWARRKLGLEISLTDIIKAGTVGNLANTMMENLRTKFTKE